MAKAKKTQKVEEKLKLLYELQTIDSKIDEIKILRGELPLQVRDLEDEIQGLSTRLDNFGEEVTTIKQSISDRENKAKEAKSLIEKYEKQQSKVRNNREFDSLNKEIEFQTLEIELSKKRIKEHKLKLEETKAQIKETEATITDVTGELDAKKGELENIVSETQKEEDKLLKKSKKIEETVDERLLIAYKRIRANMRNGLAIVTIQRDACGGCYNKIPPQKKLDIATRSRIIVCEHCGRILVDPLMGEE